jgi:hypothetical protein
MEHIFPKLTAGFDPEVLKAMGDAYDMICSELYKGDKTPFIGEVIAERIVHLAKSGERDPQRIADMVLGRADPALRITNPCVGHA